MRRSFLSNDRWRTLLALLSSVLVILVTRGICDEGSGRPRCAPAQAAGARVYLPDGQGHNAADATPTVSPDIEAPVGPERDSRPAPDRVAHGSRPERAWCKPPLVRSQSLPRHAAPLYTPAAFPNSPRSPPDATAT